MKKSMIAVYDYLEKNDCGKIVLQIHDEILVEIPADKAEKIITEISIIMESIVNWSVALRVNAKVNYSWS